MNTEQIREGLIVRAVGGESGGKRSAKGLKGVQVGKVDHMEGSDYIKLKKSDQNGAGHHWLQVSHVENVDDKAIYVDLSPQQFRSTILNEKPNPVH